MQDERPDDGNAEEGATVPDGAALDALAEAQREAEATLAENDARIEELGESIEQTRRAIWRTEKRGVGDPAAPKSGGTDGDDG